MSVVDQSYQSAGGGASLRPLSSRSVGASATGVLSRGPSTAGFPASGVPLSRKPRIRNDSHGLLLVSGLSPQTACLFRGHSIEDLNARSWPAVRLRQRTPGLCRRVRPESRPSTGGRPEADRGRRRERSRSNVSWRSGPVMLPVGRDLVAHSLTTYSCAGGLRENMHSLAFRQSSSASVHEEHSGLPGCEASRPKLLAGEFQCASHRLSPGRCDSFHLRLVIESWDGNQ